MSTACSVALWVVIAVTGVSGGIGAAIAAMLGTFGHEVFALGRDLIKGQEACAGVTVVVPVVLDLAEPVVALPKALGRSPWLDLLVHCAGVADVASVGEAEVDL